MKIPKIDIEAMCDYIESDLEMGVQMNFLDWRQSLANVREWLEAVEHTLAPDGAYCTCQVNWSDNTKMCWRCSKPIRPAGKA